jgi:hypothetical protein
VLDDHDKRENDRDERNRGLPPSHPPTSVTAPPSMRRRAIANRLGGSLDASAIAVSGHRNPSNYERDPL